MAVPQVDLELDPETHDLKLNEDGTDLVVLRDEPTVIAQRIRVRLRMWKGSWFFDADAYVDYRNKILIKSPQLSVVTGELRRVIESTPGVKRILQLEVDYDAEKRVFKAIDGIVELESGLRIVVSDAQAIRFFGLTQAEIDAAGGGGTIEIIGGGGGLGGGGIGEGGIGA